MKDYTKKGYKSEGYTKGQAGQSDYDKKPSDIPGKGTDTGTGRGTSGGNKTGYYKNK